LAPGVDDLDLELSQPQQLDLAELEAGLVGGELELLPVSGIALRLD